jgi:hypothetical protein
MGVRHAKFFKRYNNHKPREQTELLRLTADVTEMHAAVLRGMKQQLNELDAKVDRLESSVKYMQTTVTHELASLREAVKGLKND